MRLGGRKIETVVGAPFQRKNYVAAFNMLSVYEHPLAMSFRYLSGRGQYPAVVRVRTSHGPLDLTTYSHHDLLTINEIFCRQDYPINGEDRVVVDFGSNIGISAAYFLSNGPVETAYLFEPLPRNISRLKGNLSSFAGRYSLQEAAVGPTEGLVEFGWEESGRYGAVGLKTGNYVQVACRDSNKVLEEVISRHGQIDILKVDIENLEQEVVQRIPQELAKKIKKIYAELEFKDNPLASTHSLKQYGVVAQFSRRT
jgi:FkbM family methyltransferase